MASSGPSKDEIRALKTGIKKALRKQMSFFYCAGGEDGDPILVIDRQVTSTSAKVRKTATLKQFAAGDVVSEDGRKVIFVVHKSTGPKLERHVKTWFGKGVPELKKVELISLDEWDKRLEMLPGIHDPPPDDLPESGDGELDEPAASLGYRASQVLKHSQKYVKIASKVIGAYNMGEESKQKRGVARLEKQQETLDKWTIRVLESAEAYVEAIEAGQVDKASAKPLRKEILAAGKMLWQVHLSFTHDHGPDYPSKKMKRFMGRLRGRVKKAAKILK